MSKQLKAISIIILVVIVSIGLLAYFFLISNEKSIIKNDNAFGEEGTVVSNPGPAIQETPDIENKVVLQKASSRLRLISEDPVSGISSENGNSVVYIDRVNGHVYEMGAFSANSSRISNTTIPKIHEAALNSDQTNIIFRYLDETNLVINTLIGTLEKETESEEITGKVLINFLPQNVRDITFSPSGDRVAYSVDVPSGSNIIVSDVNLENPRNIFNSVLREWNIFWVNSTSLILATRPSYSSEGYVYSLPTNGGSLRKIIGGQFGLSVKPNSDGSLIAYSKIVNNEPLLYVYNRNTGEHKNVTIKTLADKCTWTRSGTEILYCAAPQTIENGELPDSWYQGYVSFVDSFWSYDVDENQTRFLFSPSEYDAPEIDGVDLTVSADNNFLYFRNKKDSRAWSFNINYSKGI